MKLRLTRVPWQQTPFCYQINTSEEMVRGLGRLGEEVGLIDKI
jgi:hypothetical protein